MADSRRPRRRTAGASSSRSRDARPAFIEGWISNPEKHVDFSNFWKERRLMAVKFIRLDFYRFYGFQFPYLFGTQGLTHLVEQKGCIYPDLIRVFYFNLKYRDGIITTKVKGVPIILDDDIWTNMPQLTIWDDAVKVHLGVPNFNCLLAFQSFLRHPQQRKNSRQLLVVQLLLTCLKRQTLAKEEGGPSLSTLVSIFLVVARRHLRSKEKLEHERKRQTLAKEEGGPSLSTLVSIFLVVARRHLRSKEKLEHERNQLCVTENTVLSEEVLKGQFIAIVKSCEQEKLALCVLKVGAVLYKLAELFPSGLFVVERERNYLISKVKGVTVRIDDSIWKYVVGFQPGGLKAHHGVSGLNKVYIYNNLLKDLNMIGKCDSFKDMYLLYALQTSIQTDWASVIGDYMMKVAKKNEYHLPYVVFISKILRLQNVDITNEITIVGNKRNVIEKLFLEHSGLRKSKEGWIFKEKFCSDTDKVDPINIDKSRYEFRPQTKFEEFVEVRFKRLDEKMSMLQKSFTELHRKMDYALRINAFGDTYVDDSESEKNNADEKIVKSSETE
ncbi:hypothetical protein LR48_Vigan05g118800 [Vigna angularis]|uniref:Uncharacterized protein n=1 Tax=Phaseolus angularis TaxID=3914 RepID=A0A0L9ULG1_PHAAN|nr:hypothetical protein LR48_Vigan05g118800 [Vigna angularis]